LSYQRCKHWSHVVVPLVHSLQAATLPAFEKQSVWNPCTSAVVHAVAPAGTSAGTKGVHAKDGSTLVQAAPASARLSELPASGLPVSEVLLSGALPSEPPPETSGVVVASICDIEESAAASGAGLVPESPAPHTHTPYDAPSGLQAWTPMH